MKTVIRKMQETAAESGLWERLRREGWNITEELESVQKSHSRSNGGEVCLVVTDTLEGASYAKERNLACLGVERPKTGVHFFGVDMATEDLSGVEGSFLQLVWKRHWNLPWEIAQTPRLVLRESVLEDLEAFYRIYEDEEITAYIPGMPVDKEQGKEELEAYISQIYPLFGYGLWTVIEKETGQVIVRAGLEHTRDSDGEGAMLELGYVIGKPWQGKGYGTEAAMSCAAYAFSEVEAEYLAVRVHKDNLPSRKVAEHLERQYPGKVQIFLL